MKIIKQAINFLFHKGAKIGKGKTTFSSTYNTFKVGDKVEFHKGGFGKVTFANEWTCTVLWNDTKPRGNPANSKIRGKNYSISLPVDDMSPKFNPIIRRAK